jgi:hypothetical protein
MLDRNDNINDYNDNTGGTARGTARGSGAPEHDGVSINKPKISNNALKPFKKKLADVEIYSNI